MPADPSRPPSPGAAGAAPTSRGWGLLGGGRRGPHRRPPHCRVRRPTPRRFHANRLCPPGSRIGSQSTQSQSPPCPHEAVPTDGRAPGFLLVFRDSSRADPSTGQGGPRTLLCMCLSRPQCPLEVAHVQSHWLPPSSWLLSRVPPGCPLPFSAAMFEGRAWPAELAPCQHASGPSERSGVWWTRTPAPSSRDGRRWRPCSLCGVPKAFESVTWQ